MKSPWQIGLLAMAVTGVSVYDVHFFKQHRAQSQVSMQIQAPQAITEAVAPIAAPSIESATSVDATGFVSIESVPPISREKLQRYAQQEFIPKEFQEIDIESDWPRRDPFEMNKETGVTNQGAQSKALVKEARSPLPLPEPQYIFSGTLIERERRLALIDGVPRSIGARLGVWQLARIEPDHIILEAGGETRRIELKGVGPQVTRQKDPL